MTTPPDDVDALFDALVAQGGAFAALAKAQFMGEKQGTGGG